MIENLDILTEHISEIYDENGVRVIYDNVLLKIENRKYSSTESILVYLDNKPLTSKQIRSYKIIYKCRCGRLINILLYKYIHKDRIVCQHCLQDKSFDYYIVANKTGKKSLKGPVSRLKNISTFDEQSDEFKEQYKSKHLSNEEFQYYIKHIYQINTHIISDINSNCIIYHYATSTNNQMKFTPKISFDNGVTFETIHKVYLKCSVCGKIHKIHLCNIRNKNIDEIKCRACSLTNKRYPIRLYDNSGLTYQSNLEKRFIEMIKMNNIPILNGLKIEYYFNDKKQNIYY